MKDIGKRIRGRLRKWLLEIQRIVRFAFVVSVAKLKRRRKVFDCFMLYEEIELLQLRLMEYYEYVDFFVIVESKKTFKGKDHELIFPKNKSLFSDYLDKVIYLAVDWLPENSEGNIWVAEAFQRNYIDRALKEHATLGDVIILSDIDEFWDVEQIDMMKNTVRPFVFRQKLFYYFVNCYKDDSWLGTCVAPYGIFKPQEMREYARFDERHRVVADGGWHYSYMGGTMRIRSKLENLSDSHLVRDKVGSADEINRKIDSGIALWDDNSHYEFIEIDKSNTPRKLADLVKKYPALVKGKN